MAKQPKIEPKFVVVTIRLLENQTASLAEIKKWIEQDMDFDPGEGVEDIEWKVDDDIRYE